MELLVKKKEIVGVFLKNNVLVSREVLAKLDEPGVADQWYEALSRGGSS